MEVIIIPDVHGRNFWKEVISLTDSVDKIIFLGDYLDPYPRENISKDVTIVNFKEILNFKKDNPEKVVLLLGNHDCEYAISKKICNCRCDLTNYKEIQDLFRNNFDLFEILYKFEQRDKHYLCSHAGIADKWLNTVISKDAICDRIVYLQNLFAVEGYSEDSLLAETLAEVGIARWGSDPVGSIIWRDITEPISEKYGYQIFGHTQLKQNPIVTDKWACLDIREAFKLKDGEIYNLKDELCKKINLQDLH